MENHEGRRRGVNTEIIRKALEIGLAKFERLKKDPAVYYDEEIATITAALAELDGAEARPEANEILDRALRFGNVPVRWTCPACKSRHEWWWKPLDVQAGKISMRCPNCHTETPCLMDRDGSVRVRKQEARP
jgi:hypothetical protein